MPKAPQGIKTTLDVVNHHNGRPGWGLSRCKKCGTLVSAGKKFCQKCK
jgi:hypothetical protein